VSRLSIDKLAQDFMRGLHLTEREASIAERVVKEINERLRFLLDVGLDYLTLSRPAGTLSGGEAQRIRLATQIGSGLVGVLYVLDEPSIGLHQRDNRRLIETLVRLRNLGNTLIVVEHDEDTIRTADYVVDIGPGAGEHGGEVVVAGSVDDLAGQPGVPHRRLPVRAQADRRAGGAASRATARRSRRRATENNLRDVTVDFPCGGSSPSPGCPARASPRWSTRSSTKALARHLYGKDVPGRHKRIIGLDEIDKAIHVDQSPIGRTPRSNPATYTGVFDKIRKLFAETPRRRRAATSPDGSASTSRAAAARTARATARSRSR
jgi:excinuclease ABC subunit A